MSKHKPLEPAASIIALAGGYGKTAEIVGCNENWVYRWTYPIEKGGTGGRIPQKAQFKLLEARKRGVVEFEPAMLLGIAAE